MSSLQGDPTSQDSVPGVTHPQSPGQSPPELAPGSYFHCLYGGITAQPLYLWSHIHFLQGENVYMMSHVIHNLQGGP